MTQELYERIFADAYERGFDKGMNIGYGKGVVDGSYEGKLEEQTQIARKMLLRSKLSVEDIADITDLSCLYIEKLGRNIERGQ